MPVGGNPVQFVSTPADGVPMFGVIIVGLVWQTTGPLPVTVESPEEGNPVQFVNTPAEGVPMFGVTNTGFV